jgi:c-di-GMP-binding flagellar brake protein YcgR
MEKLRALLSGRSCDRTAVRRALEQCARQGRQLTIESTRNRSSSESMSASIELVREDDFIIDLPMVGGRVRPLAINEPLRIGFMTESGFTSGLTKPLSRFRFSSGGEDSSRVLYGYRMGMPDELHTNNRRSAHRVSIEHAHPVYVTLHAPGTDQTMRATILDISASGMRLRLEQHVMLIDGQEMLLMAELPMSCGSVEEPVRIVRVMQCPRTELPVVGVSFPEEVVSVARYVRQLEIQHARRAGAA